MKRAIALILLTMVCVLCGCTNESDSHFQITFIDVGQGDSALVECDDHYMLIDAGDTNKGEKVYKVLSDKNITSLDYLIISHMHSDHVGGLKELLDHNINFGRVLSNADQGSTQIAQEIIDLLKSQISIPQVDDKFSIGSASFEVVDVDSTDENDSLVIMLTYGKNEFMFTGDIEYKGQHKIAEKYINKKDYSIDLIKMPHHGSADSSSLNGLISALMPKCAVISCGAGNIYGHPHRETLDLLNQAGVDCYRTDINGNIIVSSDGKNLTIKTER